MAELVKAAAITALLVALVSSVYSFAYILGDGPQMVFDARAGKLASSHPSMVPFVTKVIWSTGGNAGSSEPASHVIVLLGYVGTGVVGLAVSRWLWTLIKEL